MPGRQSFQIRDCSPFEHQVKALEFHSPGWRLFKFDRFERITI